MTNTIELHLYGSPCCNAATRSVAEVIVKIAPGCTAYYRDKCVKCGKLCHPKLTNVWDSEGVEILHGDIVECPMLAPGVTFAGDHAERWHAARITEYGLDIRDLGNNNSHMYRCWPPYFNRGPYWRHLGMLDDDDLDFYWGTTRAEAEKLLK